MTLGSRRQLRLPTARSEGGRVEPGKAARPCRLRHQQCRRFSEDATSSRASVVPGGANIVRQKGPSNQVEADFIVGQHRGASVARAGFQGHQLLQVSVMSAQTRAMPQPGLSYRSANFVCLSQNRRNCILSQACKGQHLHHQSLSGVHSSRSILRLKAVGAQAILMLNFPKLRDYCSCKRGSSSSIRRCTPRWPQSGQA